jgi:hypothetical protein
MTRLRLAGGLVLAAVLVGPICVFAFVALAVGRRD